jgi:cysteine synthase A
MQVRTACLTFNGPGTNDGAMIYSDLTETIGGTPLLELQRIGRGLPSRIVAKLDMRNPCGSVKDRLGLALIEDAERSGRLKPGMTLIEATGGNTGIGLALAAAVRGYRLILTMPEAMSQERVALLQFLGAEIHLTPGILMADAVAKARQMANDLPNSLLMDQFNNPANPHHHRLTTGMEIWEGTDGQVDAFVCAVGTGGTITGVGEALKERNPQVRIIAVEPEGAAVLSGGKPGNHQMPGIGVGFIPKVLNRNILDDIVIVSDEDAFQSSRLLARKEGVMAGVSSGAALHAAMIEASRPELPSRTIVVFLADTAERYLSTALFDTPPAQAGD